MKTYKYERPVYNRPHEKHEILNKNHWVIEYEMIEEKVVVIKSLTAPVIITSISKKDFEFYFTEVSKEKKNINNVGMCFYDFIKLKELEDITNVQSSTLIGICQQHNINLEQLKEFYLLTSNFPTTVDLKFLETYNFDTLMQVYITKNKCETSNVIKQLETISYLEDVKKEIKKLRKRLRKEKHPSIVTELERQKEFLEEKKAIYKRFLK